MFSQKNIDFGRKPNVIRDLSAYAGRRKQEIGAENVFDFSIGSPNVPAPKEVHEVMLDLMTNADPVAIHSYTGANGMLSARQAIADSITRRFGDHVDAGGVFISSGILLEKRDQVAAAVEAAGFEILEIPEDGEWCAIAAQKK